MHAPRVLILRAPGANCDNELQFAFERAGAIAHVDQLVALPVAIKEIVLRLRLHDQRAQVVVEQQWNPGALAWETGTGPTALIHGLDVSLRLISSAGIGSIASYLEQLTDHLCNALKTGNYDIVSSRLPGEKSQIVCIRHRGDLSPMALYSRLKDRNIVTAPRGDRLRIAPHLYNTVTEIDELIANLP